MSSVESTIAIEPGTSGGSAAQNITTTTQPRACSVGVHFPLNSYPNYKPERDFDLAVFVHRLYLPQCVAAKGYLHVKSLSFHLPFDSMIASGLLGRFAIYHKNDIPEPAPDKQLPGDLGIAAGMCRQALETHRGNPWAVPVRKWWQIIVFLLRHCVNVETIEVPTEWWDVTWYAPRFPKVDPASRRYLPNGRICWGKDPVHE